MADLDQAFDQPKEQFEEALIQVLRSKDKRINHQEAGETDCQLVYAHLFRVLYDSKVEKCNNQLRMFYSNVDHKAKIGTLAISIGALTLALCSSLVGITVDLSALSIQSTDVILGSLITGGGIGFGSSLSYAAEIPHLIISKLTKPRTLSQSFHNLELVLRELNQTDVRVTINPDTSY